MPPASGVSSALSHSRSPVASSSSLTHSLGESMTFQRFAQLRRYEHAVKIGYLRKIGKTSRALRCGVSGGIDEQHAFALELAQTASFAPQCSVSHLDVEARRQLEQQRHQTVRIHVRSRSSFRHGRADTKRDDQSTRVRDSMSRLPPGAVADSPPQDAERRLHAQFEKLEQQFLQLKNQTRQLQRLASLGTAATMLAHEFNNLMTPVVSYAQYAADSGDPELMAKALRMTLKQTGIVTSMSDRILGLATNEARPTRKVAVREMVEDAEACLFRDLSKDGIRLNADVDDSLCVLADPGQMQQVFFNLLINARQAIKHRNGRITISARRDGDEYVAIDVADNGCGIAPDRIDRVFDEFYSTKEDRPDKSGLGLGLSLCRDIVEEHRGTISVRSEPEKGTTFTIRLPSAD